MDEQLKKFKEAQIFAFNFIAEKLVEDLELWEKEQIGDIKEFLDQGFEKESIDSEIGAEAARQVILKFRKFISREIKDISLSMVGNESKGDS